MPSALFRGEELFEGGPGDGWTEHFLGSEFARVVKDTDLLVRVYSSAGNVYHARIVAVLDEANAEEAWEAAAEHGCDDRQWLRVAALRETSHPEDAIGVYIPRLEAKVRLTNTSLYPEAAELARRVRELYERLGRMDEAESFTKGLRTEHRRKRRFLAELDRVGLGG